MIGAVVQTWSNLPASDDNNSHGKDACHSRSYCSDLAGLVDIEVAKGRDDYGELAGSLHLSGGMRANTLLQPRFGMCCRSSTLSRNGPPRCRQTLLQKLLRKNGSSHGSMANCRTAQASQRLPQQVQ